MIGRHALALLVVAAFGCARDAPDARTASVAEAEGGAATPPTPTASESAIMNAPAADVTMKLSVTEEHASAGDSLRLVIALENHAAVPKTIGYYQPLGFQLAVSDPKSGRELPLVIAPYDIPVQHVAVTLAPGESRSIGSVRLWFDETGTPRPTMFEWTVQSRRVPLKLRAKLEVTGSDGGTLALSATAISP